MGGQALGRCANGCCAAPSKSAQDRHILDSSKLRKIQHHLSRFPGGLIPLSPKHCWSDHWMRHSSLHSVRVGSLLSRAWPKIIACLCLSIRYNFLLEHSRMNSIPDPRIGALPGGWRCVLIEGRQSEIGQLHPRTSRMRGDAAGGKLGEPRKCRLRDAGDLPVPQPVGDENGTDQRCAGVSHQLPAPLVQAQTRGVEQFLPRGVGGVQVPALKFSSRESSHRVLNRRA